MADKDKFADEMLSDDELDVVAGGTTHEVTTDAMFLFQRGLIDSYHLRRSTTERNLESASRNVVDGWAKIGVACEPDKSGGNKYFMGGKQVERWEALEYTVKQRIKIRNL